MGMTKQEALARLEKLRSALERMPDETGWVYPALDGCASLTNGEPNIHCTVDDEFSALAEHFKAQPTRRDFAPDWDALTFEVDGVILYNLRKRKEDNEHGEQGSGNRESSGGLPDGESPEENRVERGHSGSGHQTDGEYPS